MKKKKYIAFFTMLALTYVITGQVPQPAGPPPPPGLAIDGGLVFLVVSGILYGVKKVKK
jgi:hypothetical protein